MRVFVTGSTGFVGSAVVKELLSGGHEVLGLARSDKGVEQLKGQGAEVLRGNIEDLQVLKKGASECDAVIHLAFIHNFADFAGSCATDRAAITAMGSVLAAADGDRALVVTSGTMMLAHGKLGDEDHEADMTNSMAAARGASEPVCLDFAKKGVRTSVGVSAYVAEGHNRWCACHRDDAAKVYRLAVEKAKPGSIFHAVAEEGVPLKDIATEVGKQLNIPVVSIASEEMEDHFGWFHFGITADNEASSTKTRERLGWTPVCPSVIEDVPAIIDFLKSQAN
ncbi:oxidoreductase [Penicillium riverlandense]|uniref:oxidoreductase n=1 Tax=Penicillium riverlandense TaxID=1903569 RepID=UPI0025472A8A|nr:oxidoreductase [Penicillium riverlandense]KAJ5833345.1 oxidoreductase [Penicillium riverlandense]